MNPRNSLICIAAGAFMALAAMPLLISCKGRTLDNVQPLGETIEVTVPEQIPETQPDMPGQTSQTSPDVPETRPDMSAAADSDSIPL